MTTITRSQLQELVKEIPDTHLPVAYALLSNLVDNNTEADFPQFALLKLPLEERRRILAKQAMQMTAHYEADTEERLEWQAGDFSGD